MMHKKKLHDDYSLIASKAKHELAKATERTGLKILTQSFSI